MSLKETWWNTQLNQVDDFVGACWWQGATFPKNKLPTKNAPILGSQNPFVARETLPSI